MLSFIFPIYLRNIKSLIDWTLPSHKYYLQCHSYVSNYWDIPKFWLHPKTQRKYNLRLEISNQRHDQKKGYEAHQMYNAQLKGISKKYTLSINLQHKYDRKEFIF